MITDQEVNYAKEYQACLVHLFEIEELKQQTGHFGALFAQKLIAQEAFIKKLAADQAFLRQLVVQKLRIDSDKNSNQDFEAWFDEENGLKIKNNGEEIFKVDPRGFAVMKKAKFEGEIDCQGFQVLNVANTNPVLQFYWRAGDDGITCGSKLAPVYNADHYFGKGIGVLIKTYYGDGNYGGKIIRCIIYKRHWWFGGLSVSGGWARLELLDNSGSLVAIISAAKDSKGNLKTDFTEEDESRAGWQAYRPCRYNFDFYTYTPSQKVIIPNISFGKAAEKNVLYRDGNGFIKIS